MVQDSAATPGVTVEPVVMFIVVELGDEPGASSWKVTGVFLSAHCFGRGAASCGSYRGPDLQRFRWHDGGPIIWVAEGKHANYPSWQACNVGHRMPISSPKARCPYLRERMLRGAQLAYERGAREPRRRQTALQPTSGGQVEVEMAKLREFASYCNSIHTRQFPTGSWLEVKWLALPGLMSEIDTPRSR
jgi:hypothetical protein